MAPEIYRFLPEANLAGIEKSLEKAGNKKLTIHKLNGLNHLFQPCKTGLVDEYKTIETTIDSKVLDIISDWLNKL